MKKTLNLLILLIFIFTLVSCNNNQAQEEPSDIDLTTLGYYDYLDSKNPVVTIVVKDIGRFKLQLFPEVAENTVNNFIKYVEDKAYNNSNFHRIIQGFMIQGGGVTQTRKAIPGQFSSNGFDNPLKHFRGVLSMARTNVTDSATSQFFIMHALSPHLDGQYASFGGLTHGFDVLDEIATVYTDYFDAPLSRITIESVTIQLNGYKPKDIVYASNR